MQKIVGWKFLVTVGLNKQFEPIYEEIPDKPQEKCNDSWPFVTPKIIWTELTDKKENDGTNT